MRRDASRRRTQVRAMKAEGLGASEIAKALKIGYWIYFQWPVLDWRLVRFEKADFVDNQRLNRRTTMTIISIVLSPPP
jgi:hypothetical protein